MAFFFSMIFQAQNTKVGPGVHALGQFKKEMTNIFLIKIIIWDQNASYSFISLNHYYLNMSSPYSIITYNQHPMSKQNNNSQQ